MEKLLEINGRHTWDCCKLNIRREMRWMLLALKGCVGLKFKLLEITSFVEVIGLRANLSKGLVNVLF